MYYCEIDTANYKHEATVTDKMEGFAEQSVVLQQCRRLSIDKDELLIDMEATGHY